MTTVVLYTLTAHEVELADGFTASRQPGGVGPVCCLGDGSVLLGARQQPLGAVWQCGQGEYIALSPELHTILEAPLLAEFKAAFEREKKDAWLYFTAAPLWLRIWRAITC